MRLGKFAPGALVALVAQASAPAHAGLINPTSTVDIYFDYVNPNPANGPVGTFTAPSQPFNGGLQPFSLATAIPPPSPLPITGYTAPNAPSPIHTTEPYNLSAVAGFFFTDSQVVVYANQSPPIPYCWSSGNSGSSCADPYNTFDFVFTNEDITGVSVASNSSADFAPATFTYAGVSPPIVHLGLQLVSTNEFTVDVTGDNPAYLSTLIINVTTGGGPIVPEPSTWALMLLGFMGLGLAGYRQIHRAARSA